MATSKIIKYNGWCIDRIALPIWTADGEFTISVTEHGETVQAIIDDNSDGYDVMVKLLGTVPKEFKHLFRVVDDDWTIYAYGWSKDNESERAFDPLDWASLTWGATIIEYYNDGNWEML